MQSSSILGSKFQIVLPLVHPQSDHELRAWFINQSWTTSISVKIDPTLRKNKLRGFATFFYTGVSSSGKDFFCDIRVGRSKSWNIYKDVHAIYLGTIKRTMEGHLFLHYWAFDRIQQLRSPGCDNLEFSFYTNKQDAFSWGPFGVRLVYEEDVENLEEIISNYTNEATMYIRQRGKTLLE